MKWLEIPIEELKEFDKDWETRRVSNDGTKALLHEEIYNSLVPPATTIPEGEELVEEEIIYPYPLVDESDIMNSNEWTKDEEL